ncbi:MAG: hypothetical protein KBS81_01490 [Spirochaetales bacterium]|nr:hypothetical protein [Candidatus Physcosoma equi]
MKRLLVLCLACLLLFPLYAETGEFRGSERNDLRGSLHSDFLLELDFAPRRFLLRNPLSLPLGYWSRLNENGFSFLSHREGEDGKLRVEATVYGSFLKDQDGDAQKLDGTATVELEMRYQIRKNLSIGVAGTIPVDIPEILLRP